MSKEIQKSTVTVSAAWFSQDPVFQEVLAAVKQEMNERKFISKRAAEALQNILPLNNGEPLTGYTEWGPHTHLKFEAHTLAEAILIVDNLKYFLAQTFVRSGFPFMVNFNNVTFYYGGMTLEEATSTLESAVVEAQPDLKLTRKLFPSKPLQKLRVALQRIRS